MSSENDLRKIVLPKRVFTMIEQKVVDLYVELSIGTFPVDPLCILSKVGYVLKTYSELSSESQHMFMTHDHDAITFFNPTIQTYVICYDENKSQERIKFTLMHEIGHIRLGHKEESDLARKMVDYFAAYALAPSPIIHISDCKDYHEVAEYFGISLECAEYSYERYEKWRDFGGAFRDYEEKLIRLYKSKIKTR